MPIWEKFARKSCARCREPLRASHTLPFPDLWLVDENNWFAPFLRFDHLQVSFTPSRVEYMRIQLYGMSQCLQTELVPRVLNHLEHFPKRTHTHDTHTNTKTGTPDCLLTSNKLTIQSLAKFKWKVLSRIMIRFGQHNVHMTKHDKTWPCHLNPMSRVWSRYSWCWKEFSLSLQEVLL